MLSKPALSRRALVSAAAAAAATAMLPVAALPANAAPIAGPDPIFAVIDAHKRVHDDFNNFFTMRAREKFGKLGLSGGELDAAMEEEELRLLDIDHAAAQGLFLTPPTTIAGVAALLRYLDEMMSRGDNVAQTYIDDGSVGDMRPVGCVSIIGTLVRAFDRMAGAEGVVS